MLHVQTHSNVNHLQLLANLLIKINYPKIKKKKNFIKIKLWVIFKCHMPKQKIMFFFLLYCTTRVPGG